MESWNNEDAKRLKRFLNSDTGKKLIEDWKTAMPSMDDKTIEGRAMQAASFQQYRADENFIKSKRDFEETPQSKPAWIDTSGLEVNE